jgi:hypothetical protein
MLAGGMTIAAPGFMPAAFAANANLFVSAENPQFNNEIGRKITSLTLMTIMLAGGMTIAAPGFMPAAFAANANLFVSAENSQFDNYMSGPQVIEVVVIDSDIDDTDEGKGEPDVTVNGKIMRMAQAVDGNWYGYFADQTKSSIADSTTTAAGTGLGLNFGTLCATGTTTETFLGITIGDTVGVSVPLGNLTGSIGANGTSTGDNLTVQCALTSGGGATGDNANTTGHMNVVREAKDLNLMTGITGGSIGQIGLSDKDVWPFIQFYDLNPTGNVVVQYNKGGGAQSTTLTFDTVDNFASASLDRTVYPTGGQVHVTVTDLWLNIDPTDEDSWTWTTLATNSTGYYQVFDENGNTDHDGTLSTANDIVSVKSSLMCEDNCTLLLNADAQSTGSNIVTLNDNDDVAMTSTGSTNSLSAASQPITLTEQGPNSGVFGTYDESDTSIVQVASNAPRGKSATIDYNETPATILVGFDFATLNINPTDDEWNSGEEVPVVLVDGDANKNSRADEDLDLNINGTTLIPSLQTGDPFTLGDGSSVTAMFTDVRALGNFIPSAANVGVPQATYGLSGENRTSVNFLVDSFSQRGIFSNQTSSASTFNATIIDLNTDIDELKKSIGDTRVGATDRLHGFNFLNIDVRSLTTGLVDVYLINGTLDTTSIQNDTNFIIQITNDVKAQSLTNINSTSINTVLFDERDAGTAISLMVVANSTTTDDVGSDPFVIDFFSFGFTNDGLEAGERIANQIVRLELEEDGDNSSTFVGSLEYTMINQLNILDVNTYSGLSPIANDPTFIVIEDLTDEDSPRVNYFDLGADGVSTQVADQEEAPSHSGIVSFDSDNYKNADTVTITLDDLDLNVDSDLIEIYTTVSTTGNNLDAVGSADAPTGTSIPFSNGEQLGRLLDITFDDQRWTTPAAGDCLTALNTASITDTGLAATGFTLIETDSESGRFLGDFQIPAAWCRSGATATESATGLDIEVNYVDFRDASGEVIEVGDSAGVRANTGSVSLDRTVYPVPFGIATDFTTDSTNTSQTVEHYSQYIKQEWIHLVVALAQLPVYKLVNLLPEEI